MGKIIFVDVDGTLLNYENELPESAVLAIKQARKNNHKVYICTGRSRAEVYEYIWDIGLDGMIGGNGSYVENNNEVLMHKTLSLEECTEIVNWLKDRKLEFYLECNGGLYGSDGFKERGQPVIREYSFRKGKENAESLSVVDVFPEMIFNDNLYRDDVNKISFILNSYQDHLDSKEKFKNLKANTWGGSGEKALFGDLGLKEIDKASAIAVLLKHLDAKVEDTIAFGDAKIDVGMLEYCAIGVAMGSGGEEVKAVADYITDSVYEDGLYNAFKHFNLI